jgi:hypothetical protein
VKKTYISVCKNTIARNQKLPHEKRIGPIRISEGKYGKPRRVFGVGMSMHDGDYVSVCYASPGGIDKPMPWGARTWMEVSRKQK